MDVLVTGGAGFVGANLAVYLAGKGHRVVALDNLVRRGSEFNLRRLKSVGVRFVHGDCRCLEDIPMPMTSFDAVCHTAAQPSAIDGYQAPMFELANNVGGLFSILELCHEQGAALVFWASNKVYPCNEIGRLQVHETADAILLDSPVCEWVELNGDDRSLYGATKLAGETLAREYGRAFDFPVYINRFSCLAGPWQWGKTEQGWVAWWVIAHRLGLPLTYYGFQGKQTRDVLHIADVCALVERQLEDSQGNWEHFDKKGDTIRLEQPTHGGVYNVGGGMQNVLSLQQATRMCQEITGNKVPISVEDEPRPCDFASYVSDIRRVSNTFNWAPTKSPYETLQDIDAWVTEAYPTLEKLYKG